jgi:hypothetical protein
MPRSDPSASSDRSTAIAVTAFTAAATLWIGVLATQPTPAALIASAPPPTTLPSAMMVMTVVPARNVAVTPPQPRRLTLADLSR